MATNYLILWLALGGAVLAVVGFVWMVRTGQMDDLDTPPHRVLFDDVPPVPPVTTQVPATQAATSQTPTPLPPSEPPAGAP